MIFPKLLTLVLLSTAGVQAAFFAKQPVAYDSSCGKQAVSKPEIGTICFDLDFDLRQHLQNSSPGMVGYLAKDDSSRVALPVGREHSRAWFETVKHQVDMESLYNKDNILCVQYTIAPLKSFELPIHGQYCPNDRHVSF